LQRQSHQNMEVVGGWCHLLPLNIHMFHDDSVWWTVNFGRTQSEWPSVYPTYVFYSTGTLNLTLPITGPVRAPGL